jgi:hypothetical protein
MTRRPEDLASAGRKAVHPFVLETDGVAHAEHRRVAGIRLIAAGLPDVLEIRLKRPTLLNLRRVADFEERLEIARSKDATPQKCRKTSEQNPVQDYSASTLRP